MGRRRFNVIGYLALVLLIMYASIGWATQQDRSLKRNTQQNETRTALVIGNSAYTIKPLKNPVNDAKDMAKTLTKLGFSVQLELNANKEQMVKAISSFGKKLRKGGVGLFYFAGHGIQFEGNNYLIPVGGMIDDEDDVFFEAVRADRVLAKMKRAGNSLNMVFLDACRDNPYATEFRSTSSKGLVGMKAAKGALIAYATAPGSVAADGNGGRNGLYTRYLLKYINQPGITVEEMLKKVRQGVSQETNDKQVPWESSSLVGRFYFGGQEKTSNTVVEAPAGTGNSSYTTDGEKELWTLVKKSNNAGDYDYFLKAYPHGIYSATARLKLLRLQQEAQKSTLTVKTTPEDARVRVLNIKEKYQPGISLKPGSYTIEVSAKGYGKKIERIMLPASEEYAHTVILKSSGPKKGDTYRDPITGMEFVYIPGGCFQMGSPSSEEPRGNNEGPVHEVCVDGFYMGKYEVSQGEYRRITGSNPSAFKSGDNYPVEKVSWNDAQSYVDVLNQKSGKKFRLPTEAEWEYAARAGTSTPFSFGNTISTSQANYNGNSTYGSGLKGVYRSKTTGVGSFSANRFGLFDMHGNVWEWCSDWYGDNYYSRSPRKNPQGPSSGDYRVHRGGSCYNLPRYVRSANRSWFTPGGRNYDLGFRLLLQASSVQ